MLSFASRSSYGIRKNPLYPLCRVHTTLNSSGCGRPAAFLGRGFSAQAQAQAPAATKKATAQAKAKTPSGKTPSSKSTSQKSTSKKSTSKKSTSEKSTSEKSTGKKSTGKRSTSKKSTSKEASDTPQSSPSKIEGKNPVPALKKTPKKGPFKTPTPHSPEEVSALWEKSMDIVSDLNKIGPTKLTDSQVTLMAGTLDVIKTVLESQARKMSRADGKAQSSADADEANKEQAGKTSKTDKSSNTAQGDGLTNVLVKALGAPIRRVSSGTSTATPESGASDMETKKKAKGWKKQQLGVRKLETGGILKPIAVPTPPVPLIQYGLDRVLFNEGVYNLQDPRTGVFNFDPYLAEIMPVTEFDFDALKEYITSSKDTTLLGVTKDRKKKYTGSTSSMTATLAHFHFLLSNWRQINLARISREYDPEQQSFVGFLKAPAATFLNYNDGVYAIDADKEWDDETVLSMLGKSMELLLTAPKDEYEKYRRTRSHTLTEEERNKPESYHYTEFEDFVMRSQLDAYDPRLPGTGVYDLKTRAVVSIRMDALNYKKGRTYEISKRTGEWESFEREYHDMIRGAFLKYSLQVRMGRMDGIFVAFHNTQRIFGFQYIPLEEMDHSIHGTMQKSLGDREFMSSLKLWNKMLDRATMRFPHQSLRIHVETRPSTDTPFMYFFAEPVTPEEISKVQVRDQASVDKFREKVLGILPPGPIVDEAELALKSNEPEEDDTIPEEQEIQEPTNEKETANEDDLIEATDSENATQNAEEDSAEVWENMMSVVEETMENDVQGITAIRDAIEDALQQSGLLRARSSEEAQHYVDALLKAIVDVEAQRFKVKTDDETTVTSDGEQPESGSEAAQEARASQQYVDHESVTPETKSTGKSVGGFFSKLLGPFRKSETAAVEEPSSQEVADATDHPAPQSSELVDLIIKMTSRAGVPSDDAEKIQGVSDDQAKLRKFETVLSELVKADESGEAESEEATDLSKEDESDAAMPNSSAKTTQKPVFGMILTIRNQVNNDYVDRPEDLEYTDDWKIEYCMEEIPEDKVQQLYDHLKARRKRAFRRDPKARRFETMFGGALKRYSEEGALHRQRIKDLDAEKRPLFVVGNPDPFTADDISELKMVQGVPPDVEKVQSAKAAWYAKQNSFNSQPEKPRRSRLAGVGK